MATQEAVKHYQTQADLARGYDNWLNADNPHENDDGTEVPEYEYVADELMANGGELVQVLYDLIDFAEESHDVQHLCRPEYDPGDKTAGELLAVVINAYKPDDIKAAAYELRQRIRTALEPRIDEVFTERCRDVGMPWLAGA